MNIPLHLSVITAALFLTAGSAFPGTNGFELDVRELPAASGEARTRVQRAPRTTPAPAPAAARGETSTYTVRPGDHLFLILMRHYGLSNSAAERLIPEVMHLNGIKNPRGLTAGQRVIIPLSGKGHQEEERTARPAPKPALPRPVPVATAPQPSAPSATPAPLEIAGGTSCQVGRAMAEKIGLLVPSSGTIQGFSSFAVRNAGVTVEIACGLSSAEQYTYEQLLSRHNVQLLVFAEMEPSRRVIEKIANRLNLLYRTEEPAGRNRLPLRVYFRSLGDTTGETRLTVLAGDR